MTYEDRIRIQTPEGVDLELVLAGLGSRVGAGTIDLAIKWIALILLGIGLLFLTRDLGPFIFLGIYAPILLAIDIGYDIVFETLNEGRTIGKRAFGIRVVRSGGEPVAFRASAVRNILRLVDGMLSGYIVGICMVLFTPKYQRLGDLAAGTIVVRDRIEEAPLHAAAYEYRAPAIPGTWDVTLVTPEEVGTLRRFLERRHTLAPDARNRIAHELANRLRPKVGGAPEVMHPEAFIEEIVRTKTTR